MTGLLARKPVQALLCASVFLVALGATYNCVLFGDKSSLCGGYDVYRATGPYDYFMDYCIQHGEMPYWNPLMLCGMPFAANPVPMPLYPANLIRSLLTFHPTPFKTHVGLLIMMVLHLVVAGVGVVLLARQHKLSYGASFTVACVFLFGANWTRRIGEYIFVCTIAWLPLLMMLTQYVLSKETFRDKLRYGLIGGLMLGGMLLTGAMNIVPYFSVTLVGYAMLSRLAGIASWKQVRSREFARAISGDAVFLATMFVIGGLVASAVVLPGAELASMTGRIKGSEQTLASPQYHGSWTDLYQTLIRYPGLKWEVENIRGAGIGALLLVVAGLTSRRWRDVLVFGALFLLLFDCSMGRPFPLATLLERFSPIQLIASTRAFDFAVIPLGMLAGLGVDAITSAGAPLWWRGLRDGILVVVGAVTLYSLSFLLGPKSFLSMGYVAIAVPLCLLVVMLVAGWIPQFRYWPLLLAALVFTETLVWNVRYVPSIVMQPNFATWANRYPGADSFWGDNHRGVDPIQNRRIYDLKGIMHGYEPLHISRVRKVLAGDARSKTYQRSVKDFEITRENQRGNLLFKRAFWLAKQFVRGPLPDKYALFPPTTTVFLPEAENLPIPRVEAGAIPRQAVSEFAEERSFGMPEELKAINARLQLKGKKQSVALPAIRMPGLHSALRVQYTCGVRATIEVMFRDPETGEAQPGKTTTVRATAQTSQVLELPLPDFKTLRAELTVAQSGDAASFQIQGLSLLVDRADEDALIKVLSRSANTVTVSVGELKEPRVLTLLDAAYPGWNAYLDGRPVPILLADDAFKAVVVPAGTHEVRFAYYPKRLFIGVAITVTSALAALVGIVLLPRVPNLRSRNRASLSSS